MQRISSREIAFVWSSWVHTLRVFVSPRIPLQILCWLLLEDCRGSATGALHQGGDFGNSRGERLRVVNEADTWQI